jgi:hypothetical protein
VHGKFTQYKHLLVGVEASLQLGDMGLGFGLDDRLGTPSKRHRFIRGNHDDPEVCRQHPNCLDDFGVFFGTFFVGGGFSVDRDIRTTGVDWWPDEELSYERLTRAIVEYENVRPKTVASHECPGGVLHLVHEVNHFGMSRTARALDAMFKQHQPKFWVFGHHHKNMSFEHNGTRFVALKELATFEL